MLRLDDADHFDDASFSVESGLLDRAILHGAGSYCIQGIIRSGPDTRSGNKRAASLPDDDAPGFCRLSVEQFHAAVLRP